MIAYDLKADLDKGHYSPHTKYGIVTSAESCSINEPYLIEWGDGTISTHSSWEMDIMQAHANLIFDYDCTRT
jgi:hypothetical protein